ncbi:hypothetical protein KFA86_003378 [Escherichia coli]|nr:hypothetical protein [Escherichia coli]
MKKLLLLILTLCFTGISNASDSKEDLVKKTLQGDYQAQRNLAYSYMNGWDDISKDTIRGCALRKVILLTQAQADIGDYGNEAIDCRKVHPTDNQKVWEYVRGYLVLINENKK